MNIHKTINYVEFPSSNLPETKAFYENVFGWSFEDYGQEYTAFNHSGLEGGFYTSKKHVSTENGSALIAIYSEDLELTQAEIKKAGGRIIKSIFSFPGGRRFHFTDPNGNELAVWTNQ